MLTRRHVVFSGAAGLALAALRLARPHAAAAATHPYEVTHTDEEWRKLLTPEQYDVLRQAGCRFPAQTAAQAPRRPSSWPSYSAL